MRLFYFADPLCSWCYGFAPELTKLLQRVRDARLELVMGGLRPFNTERMSDAFRTMLREHWQHVQDASGVIFSTEVLDRDGFVYDTEPACRAVVTARALGDARAFEYLKAVQTAFYADGRDMTRAERLVEVAHECGYNTAHFAEALQTPAMRDATRHDFETSRSLGVSGFPTLAVSKGGELFLVASGFTKAEVIEKRLDEIDRRTAA
jgi:putative protein-disulfide isomerase